MNCIRIELLVITNALLSMTKILSNKLDKYFEKLDFKNTKLLKVKTIIRKFDLI